MINITLDTIIDAVQVDMYRCTDVVNRLYRVHQVLFRKTHRQFVFYTTHILCTR